MTIKNTFLFTAAALLLMGCGTEYQLHKADSAYAIGEYVNAASIYKSVYASTSPKERQLRAERAFRLAESYRHSNAYAKAMNAYQNAARYNYPDSIVYFYLADMQLRSGKYKPAVQNIQTYLQYAPQDTLALNLLTSAEQSQEWKNNPTRFVVKRDAFFSSRRCDYSPQLAGNNFDKLYYTSTRDDATGKDINGVSGMRSADIFVSELDEKGHWTKPKPVEGELNTEFEEGACSFSSDYGKMYLTQCTVDPQYPRPAQIVVSSRSDASWKAVQPVGSNSVDSSYTFAHPAVSPDDKWLYFVSDMDGGYGGFDLWRVPLDKDLIGAENLGPEINTAGNEMFPTFRQNGELYFSSDGHPGMGGLDIFRAVTTNDTTWTIENMQSPINSNADDFGMTFRGVEMKGYFSSNRGDARGYDNIYSFELPEVVQNILGWVYEKDGYELPDAIVYIVGNNGTNQKVGVRTDGSFLFRVSPGQEYVLLGTHKGYLNYKEELKTDSADVNKEYVLQFPLSSITKPVLIDNIFFDFDAATLRPESNASLLELVELLQNNPYVTIEIGAHTDCAGSEAYNENLSEKRAKNVVAFLISNGIEAERLTAKGYGESVPKIVTKSMAEKSAFLQVGDTLSESFIQRLPAERQEICNQLNRRTEFKVLRTTYGMY
ncbi:MAG: OmpA family protein [Bacteroidaceae bacterium]|nr:OmpA family protein [Bacteroidaceae bacterium]